MAERLRQGGGGESLDRRVAWYIEAGGIGFAVVGAFLAPELVVPGLLLAIGGGVYRHERKQK